MDKNKQSNLFSENETNSEFPFVESEDNEDHSKNVKIPISNSSFTQCQKTNITQDATNAQNEIDFLISSTEHPPALPLVVSKSSKQEETNAIDEISLPCDQNSQLLSKNCDKFIQPLFPLSKENNFEDHTNQQRNIQTSELSKERKRESEHSEIEEQLDPFFNDFRDRKASFLSDDENGRDDKFQELYLSQSESYDTIGCKSEVKSPILNSKENQKDEKGLLKEATEERNRLLLELVQQKNIIQRLNAIVEQKEKEIVTVKSEMAVLKEKTADAERKGAETDIKQMKELRIFEEEKERDTKLELNKRREEDVRNRTEEEAAREDVIDRQESKRKEENRESDEKIIDERSVEDNLIEVRNKEIVGDNNKKDDEETKLSVENSEEDVSKEKEKGEKFVALSVGQSEECSAQNEKMQAQTECVNEKQIEVSSTTQEKEESLLINQTASNSDGVQSETQSGKIENAIIQNEVIKRTEERKDSVYNDDDSSEKAHTVSSPNGKGKCRSENPKNSILFKQNKPNKNLEADIESNAQSSSGDAFSQMWKQLIHIRTSPKKTDTTIKGSETSDCSSSSGSGDDIGLDLSHEIRKTEKNACDKRETKGDSPIKASAFSAKRTEIKLEIEIPNKIEDDQEAEKYEKDSPRNVSKADKNVANTNFVQQPTSVSNKMIDSQETFDEKLRKLLFKTFLEEEHLRNESAFNSYNIRSPSPTKLFDMKEIQQITLEHSSNEIQDSSSPSFSLSSKDEPIQPSSSDKSVESVEETLQPLEKSQKRNSKKQKENLQKTNSRPLSTRRIMVKSNEKFSKSTIQSQKNGKTLDLSKSLKHPSSSTSSSSSSAAASASSSTTTTAAAAATTTSSSSKTSSSTSSLNETSKKGTISNVKNEFNKTTSTEKKAFEKKISSVKQKAELSSTSSTKQLKPNKLLSSKEAPAKTCIDHSESAKTVQDSSDHKKESCLLLDEKPSEPIQDYPIADSSEFISHKPSQHITLKSSPDKLTSAKDESSLGLQSTQTSALPVFSVRALLNSKNPKLLESVISSPVLIQKLESSLPSEQLKNPQPSLRLHSPPSHSTNPHLTLTKSQVNTVSRTPLRSPRRQASNAPAPHYLTPTASSTRSTVFASAISLSTAAGPLTATSSTQLSPSLVPRSSSFRASAPPPLPVDPISSFSPSQPHLRRIMKTSYSSNSTFR